MSFFVYEPVSVAANYSTDATTGSITGDVKEYTFEIHSFPVEFEALVSLKHGYVWGENTMIDPVMHLEPAVQSYVDSTGVVWICTGWEIDGKVYEEVERAEYSSSVHSVTCLWGVKPPDPLPDSGSDPSEPADPVEPGQDPVLAPIAFSSVSQGIDGVWTLVLTNAVKECWYHLEYTDSLSPANWLPGVSIQATADGPITFQPEGNATGSGRFWRVRATVKETDD
jgi:hypothetical protein